MTWLRQVLHVAAKDLRQWKVVYLLYAVMVTVATVHATGTWNDVGVLDGMPAFVIAAAMILAALVVQGDSPMRADAFWASHPLQSSAVAAAKIGQAVLVTLLPLMGQAVGLASRGIEAGHLGRYLPGSVGLFVVWIAAAVAVAALTRHLQEAIVAFLGVGVAFLLTTFTVLPNPQISGRLANVLNALQVIAGVAIVAVMYAKRFRARWLLPAGALAMTAPMVSLVPRSDHPHINLGASQVLHVERVDSTGGAASRMILRVWVDGVAPGERATLSDAIVVARLKNGRRLELGRYFVPLSQMEGVPIGGSFKWIGNKTFFEAAPVSLLTVNLNPYDEAVLIRDGLASVMIEGVVTVLEPRVVDTFPLRAGARIRAEDRSMWVEEATLSDKDARVTIHMTGPTPVADNELRAGLFTWTTPRFALVNDTRGEALGIRGSNMMTQNSWLVMPGTQVTDVTFNLGLRAQSVAQSVAIASDGSAIRAYESNATPIEVPSVVDGAWLRQAKVMMLDWKVRQNYKASGAVMVNR